MKLEKHPRSQRSTGNESCVVWLIFMPGFLVSAMIIFGGFADYAVLRCTRIRPQQGDCSFVRVSLGHPYYYRFPITELKGAQLQRQRRVSSSRLMIQTSSKRIPLTIYYSDSRQKQNQQKLTIQAFISNVDSDSFTVRSWPLWALFFFIPLAFFHLMPFLLVCAAILGWNQPRRR